jgi:hypothetical protein
MNIHSYGNPGWVLNTKRGSMEDKRMKKMDRLKELPM